MKPGKGFQFVMLFFFFAIWWVDRSQNMAKYKLQVVKRVHTTNQQKSCNYVFKSDDSL